MIHLAVLLSGRGSNFAAIHEAIECGELDAKIVCVISNRADAPGIARARGWGYATHVFDNRKLLVGLRLDRAFREAKRP